jgi:hypothetical protein
MQRHLLSLDFSAKPDYGLVAECLKKTIEETAAAAGGLTARRWVTKLGDEDHNVT